MSLHTFGCGQDEALQGATVKAVPYKEKKINSQHLPCLF